MKIKYLLIFLLLWAFGLSTVHAQCDAVNFTATATTGTCPTDGNISVLLPGGSPCNGWQAILTNPNGVETIQNIPNSGGPINFGALASGDYNVRLVNGPTVIQYANNPVQITTSYQTMQISSTNQAPSCPTTADQYAPNGTLEITIDNGGNGPFLYEATSQFGLQSFGPTTNTSHTFGNMEGGESVSFTVTDMGCGVSQTQNPVISTNNTTASNYFGAGFSRNCPSECDEYNVDFAILVFSQNGRNEVQIPGNATISINGGTPENLSFTNVNRNTVNFSYPPGLSGNDTFELTFNDGCNIFTETATTPPMDNDFLNVEPTISYDTATCSFTHVVNVRGRKLVNLNPGSNDTFFLFCAPNAANNITIDQEISPGNWITVLSTNSLNVNVLSYDLPGPGRYRAIGSDNCHTVTREFDTLDELNPLDETEIRSSSSILEGTGALVIDRTPGIGSSSGIPATTYEIRPVPFVSSMTINPNHPFNLGGSYTIDFPVTYTTSINRSYIGDLPPGDYEINITDECNNQAQLLHTVSELSQYNPSVEVVNGCFNSSRIIYDMNPRNVASTSNRRVDVELWTDNGNGGLGTLVQGDIPPDFLSGSFENVSTGDYILRFANINFRSNNLNENFSVVTLNNNDREYHIPVTVAPFQNISATTVGTFCDINDVSSGIILTEVTSGTPTYPMVFQLFDVTNPTVAIQTHIESDTSVTNHLFQNVSEGSYQVRITTPCDGLDVDFDLISAPIDAIIDTADAIICSPGGDVELSINLPTSLFDIVWTDDQNNTVGTGIPVTVSVTAPTTYTATYSLKPSFCASAPVRSEDIFIDFHPITTVTQVGTETANCNAAGDAYTLSVELNSIPPLTAIGTGAPGTFIGNTWTSDPIAIDTDYHLSFEDTNGCNTLEVAGNAPNCCVFEVTCPTFPAMAVECYADLPSASILTKAEFEALGNADGSIGDSPCGIIEITAVNSSDTGSCGVNATRTYTVTEYEDTNANGIRDNGENVILNTSDCQQTITVEDITPPTFVEDLPADITVICDAVPQAVTLTAMDNCGSSVQVSFSEETIFSNVTDDFIIERLWEASDSCGNVELHQQIISVTQPEIETVPIVICVGDDAIDLVDSLPQGFDTNGTFEVASGNGNLNESMLDPSSFGIGEHQVSYSSDDGTCKYLVDFTIRVNTDCLPCNALEIEASKTVTANYDGVNDFFEIKGGEYCDYVFGLQVFNRWGRIVYESSDYRNDWSGFSPNNSFGSSRTLPSGTYYYIISVKDHELKPFDGYIYLGSD